MEETPRVNGTVSSAHELGVIVSRHYNLFIQLIRSDVCENEMKYVNVRSSGFWHLYWWVATQLVGLHYDFNYV